MHNNKTDVGIKVALQIDNFKKLWIGQICSQLADKFYIVLMVYLISQFWVNTNSENAIIFENLASSIRLNISSDAQKITLLATGIYIANTIPAILLGAIAGIGSDIWPKKEVMVISNAIKALLSLLIPFFILPGPYFLGLSWGYWGIIHLTFFISTLTQFFLPAEQAAIPLIIPKKNLIAANSIYQATSMGATIIGFALGDPLLRIFRNIFLLLNINGGEFLLLPLFFGSAALFIFKINLNEKSSKNLKRNLIDEIKEGLKIVNEKPSLRGAIFNLVVLYSLLAALYVLAISLASEIPLLGPRKFGLLLAMCGVGISIGALFLAQKGHFLELKKLSAFGLGIITFSLILLGHFKGSLIITFSLCSLLGIGAALVAIPAQTTLQRDTPEEKRGKVFGLQNNLINISLSLPLVLAGAMVSSIGLLPVLWILAALSFITALLEEH